jgi:enediyne biosynthesis protein E4
MQKVLLTMLSLVLLLVDTALAQAEPMWESIGRHRSRLLSVTTLGNQRPGFIAMAPLQTGIECTNLLSVARHMTNQTLLNGSGVAAGDVDGDGLCDLYFNALDAPNRLFRNLGKWQFEDITRKAGVGCPDMDATACVLADLDGDTRVDLLVNTMYRGLRLFQNQGQGVFRERTMEAGMESALGGMTVTLGDYDLDGLPDIYVTRYRAAALMDFPNAYVNMKTVNGKRFISHFNGRSTTEPNLRNRFYVDTRGGVGEYGEPDTLYRNLGNFTFRAVDWQDGAFQDAEGRPLTDLPRDWGLAAMFRDLNHDGYPDLYVCNDFDTPDRIWINTREGGFRALPVEAIRQTSWFSMGMDVADVDRDGDDDILVLDMLARSHATRMNQLGDVKPVMELIHRASHRPQYMKTTLQMNRGDTTFAEVGQWAGLAASDWAWGVAFLDVDLDGFEDVLITNGHERDGRNIDIADQLKAMRRAKKLSDLEIFQNRLRFPRFNTPNMAMRNRGDGSFEQAGEAWGFAHDGVSHGISLADLDGDGDLDVAVNHLNEPATVYQNQATASRVSVQVRGSGGNTAGLGVRIALESAALIQSQEIIAGGKYLSSDQPMRTFAWPYPEDTNARLIVTWPGGRRETIEGIRPNRFYELHAPEGLPMPVSQDGDISPKTLFRDDSALLGHLHQDPDFDDWARQPLMEASLAHEGPALAWLDLNLDGWEDLVLTSGRGGKIQALLNREGNAFESVKLPPFHLPVSRDQVSLVAWLGRSGEVRLLAGSSNYEDGLKLGSPIREYRFKSGKTFDGFAGQAAATGPLALGDVDRDGDLDLFWGARVLPGQYPVAPSSLIFTNEDGTFVLDAERSEVFKELGMIRDAVWFDDDRDGYPELVMSRDWDSLVYFKNRDGYLVDQSVERGLSDLKGWWSGLAFGDFDNDGNLDFIAGNRGLNGPHAESIAHPVRLYQGDFDANSVRDLLYAHHEPAFMGDVPNLQLGILAQGIPMLAQRFKSHRGFGGQTVSQILESLNARAEVLEVNWPQTTLFLNRETHFEPRVLPREAQWAPVFGVVAGDFDGDGHLDVFLAQNHFQVQAMIPRMDAGLGLVCLGDGAGNLVPMPARFSGVRIRGEQRGAVAADWNRDGQLDIAVGQHSDASVLLTNQSAARGIRVQLTGDPLNLWAIGARCRLAEPGGRHGPWQLVHASRHGSLQVLGRWEGMQHLEVCWPDGTTSIHPIQDPEGIQFVHKLSGEGRSAE